MDRRKIYSTTYKNPRVFSDRKKVIKSRQRFSIIKKIIKLLFLIAIILGINMLLNNDYLKIKNIKISGEINFAKNVEEIIKKELEGPRLIIYKNNNLILFNSPKAKNDILGEIKEIKYLTIRKKFPDSLEITIKEKKPKIGWVTANKNFLIDEDGFILKETNDFKGLPVVKDISNLPVSNDKKVTYPNFISFIEDATEKLKNLKLDYDYIEIKETTFIVNIIAKEGFRMIFDSTKDLNGQVSKLEEALKQIGEQRKNLDYIDLTIKNKAIYKFK